MLAGTLTVNVDCLVDPPEYLRVRDVKGWYVDYLKGMLSEEKEDHEDLTSPLLVICSVSKDSYQQRASLGYTYQVVGGIQRYTAITKVNAEGGSRKIHTRRCAVYGSGLSREQILVLAQQHNRFNQVQRSTTFPEIAAACRRLMFLHFAEEDRHDDGQYNPPVPRYNTQKYRSWKLECLHFCVTPKVVSILFGFVHILYIRYVTVVVRKHGANPILLCQCDLFQQSESYVLKAIQMGLQPADIYAKMQQAFDQYEDGKIKGQKPRKMTESNIQKALSGQFSPKIQHFKMFQGLQVRQVGLMHKYACKCLLPFYAWYFPLRSLQACVYIRFGHA